MPLSDTHLPMGDITATNVVPILQQPLLPKLKQKLPHFLVHILVILMVMVMVVILGILIMVTILTPSSALVPIMGTMLFIMGLMVIPLVLSIKIPHLPHCPTILPQLRQPPHMLRHSTIN